MQLDQKERGFSFLKEGPLDMRMDQTAKLTAKEIVNTWPEKDLADIFYDYGEEKQSRRFAKALVRARRKKPFETTTELAKAIEDECGGRGKTHPATQVFQAIRICVNRELDSIQEGVRKALMHLSPLGKVGVISFHSLEDRLVKNIFRSASRSLKDMERDTYLPMVKRLTKKPIVPVGDKNKRARSAKMRFVQRIGL